MHKLIFIISFIVLIISSCTEDVVDNSQIIDKNDTSNVNDDSNEVVQRKIVTIIPLKGYPRDKFWIYGKHLFDSNGCTIYLNNYDCLTTVNSDSILTAIVPELDSGFYNINLAFSDTVITFPKQFQVFFGEKKHPQIDSVYPVEGKPGTIIKIFGKDFGDIPSNVKVYFANTQAQILSVTDSQIRVIVPELSSGVYDIRMTAYNTSITLSDKFCIVNSDFTFNKVVITFKNMVVKVYNYSYFWYVGGSPEEKLSIDTNYHYSFSDFLAFSAEKNKNRIKKDSSSLDTIKFSGWMPYEYESLYTFFTCIIDMKSQKILNINGNFSDYATDDNGYGLSTRNWSYRISEIEFQIKNGNYYASILGASLQESDFGFVYNHDTSYDSGLTKSNSHTDIKIIPFYYPDSEIIIELITE